MAANALDIINLNLAKTQLGIPTSENSQDEYITSILQSAITSVEKETGRCLIDKTTTETFYPDKPYKKVTLFNDGIVFNNSQGAADASLTEGMLEVFYYDNDNNIQSYNCKATRGISTSQSNAEVVIFPPSGGWIGKIDTPYGSKHFVNLNIVGPAAADVPKPMIHAALLIADGIYKSSIYDEVPSLNPVSVLLQPYKKLGI